MAHSVELVPEVNRAFSAGSFGAYEILGRCPTLGVEYPAPLAPRPTTPPKHGVNESPGVSDGGGYNRWSRDKISAS
jgi:hypothetical protein